MNALARRSLTPFLGALVVVLALRSLLFLPEIATRRSDGFAAYYTASRLLRAGDNLTDFYDDEWFNRQVGDFVPGVQDIFRPNPPVAAAILLPLAGFSYEHARIVWTLLNVVLLAATLLIVMRELNFSRPLACAFVTLALLFEPLWVNLRQGQAYIALLFLSVICWRAFRRAHDATSGIALGLMLVFKTFGVLLPLLFLRRRRWRALASGVATITLVIVLSFLPLGAAGWQKYLEALWGGRNEPDRAVTAYQTAHSFSYHLFSYDATWNPHPLLREPDAALALTLLATLATLIVVTVVLCIGRTDDLSFAALMIAAVVISPYSLDYHYSVMLLPIAILADQLLTECAPWRWLVLLSATALIAAPLPFLSSRLGSSAWALLAYPRLYGALLLLGLTLWESLRRPGTLVTTAREVRAADALVWSDA